MMTRYQPIELHSHTLNSDGAMTEKQLVERAKERGLSGIVITDHNTVSGVIRAKNAAEEVGITAISGIEWTTFWGHVVITGGKNTIDWKSITKENAMECLQKVSLSGDAITLAHPKRVGPPLCTGGYMELDLVGLKDVDCIEVWHQYLPQTCYYNLKAIEWWDSWLLQGERISATYGCDWHNLDYKTPPYALSFLGIDGEITDSAVALALKTGKIYISSGLELDISIVRNGMRVELGDTVSNGFLDIGIRINNLDDKFVECNKILPKKMRIIGNAAVNRDIDISKCQVSVRNLEVSSGYFRLEIIGDIAGELDVTLAIINPIYVK